MVAIRHLPSRRSRRLSHREPCKSDEEDWEISNLQLLYPGNEANFGAVIANGQASDIVLSHPRKVTPTATRSLDRQGGKEKIPRPRNSFIFFRSHFWRLIMASDPTTQNLPEYADLDFETLKTANHSVISSMAGKYWRHLPSSKKEIFKRMAAVEKARHAAKYPDYRYQPSSPRRAVPKRKPRSSQTSATRRVPRIPIPAANHPQYNREASLVPKAESTSPPEPLLFPSSSDNEFVPMEDIPPLDLSTEVKKEEAENEQHSLPFQAIASTAEVSYPIGVKKEEVKAKGPKVEIYPPLRHTSYDEANPYFDIKPQVKPFPYDQGYIRPDGTFAVHCYWDFGFNQTQPSSSALEFTQQDLMQGQQEFLTSFAHVLGVPADQGSLLATHDDWF